MELFCSAKLAEQEESLKWLQAELTRLRVLNLPHRHLLDLLHTKTTDAQDTLVILRALHSTRSASAYVLSGLNSISLFFASIADRVAGLGNQTPPEIQARAMILGVCNRLRLDWIQDVLVRFGQAYAIRVFFGRDPSAPILYAPPCLMHQFLSLPGIHHELGHSVWWHFPQLAPMLKGVVDDFLGRQLRQLGPALPAKRSRRETDWDVVRGFWSNERLCELFCDMFASYVCGCGNVASLIDLATSGSGKPLESEDEHPPAAARVEASFFALTQPQQASPLAQTIMMEWRQELATKTPPAEYRYACDPALLQLLAQATVDSLSRLAPLVPRFAGLPTSGDTGVLPDGTWTLEQVINHGMAVILNAPGAFDGWWTEAKRRCVILAADSPPTAGRTV